MTKLFKKDSKSFINKHHKQSYAKNICYIFDKKLIPSTNKKHSNSIKDKHSKGKMDKVDVYISLKIEIINKYENSFTS